MADKDYDDPSIHGYGHYPQDDAHESGDYGHYKDELDEDLPANFAKEAAKHQNYPESDDESFIREQQCDGNEDGAEEGIQHGNGSNPFATEAVNKGNGGSFVDNTDRPIMGYNPFLNEEKGYEKGEVDDEHVGASHEEEDLEGRDFGGPEEPAGDDKDLDSAYNRLEQDDDIQRDHVQGVHNYCYDDADRDEDEDKTAEVVDDEEYPGSHGHEFAHSEDRQDDGHYERNVSQEPDSGDFHIAQSGSSTQASLADQGHFDGYRYPHAQPIDIDYEKGGAYNDQHTEDVENIPPQAGQGDEDDLGIVNQGFSEDDGEIEGGKGIPEEEEGAESEPSLARAPDIVDTQLYDEERSDRRGHLTGQEEEYGEGVEQAIPQEQDYTQEREEDYIQEREEDYTQEREQDYTQKREQDYTQEREQYYTQEREQDYTQEREQDYTQEKEQDYTHKRELEESDCARKIQDYGHEEEEMEETSATREEYTRQQLSHEEEEEEIDQVASREADYAQEEEEMEHVSSTKEDYTREQLRHGDEMERSTIAQGEHIHDTITYEDDEAPIADSPGEKEFGSKYSSGVLLSEHEDRSFVDNLSEVTSPETIPQPLPSPPEPRNMSSFDPQVPHDSSPSSSQYLEPDENLGQHGALFQREDLEESNTAHFLTAGEVEGETKFDVDGTAITSTSQNNAFLHSDEEDEEEEEDEEQSQHLDQAGITTTATTETETSVDERSAEYGVQQMNSNDNALMSMSMEGSFYDDGGDLIGGDDKRNQDESLLYQGVSVGEEISQHESFQPKQNNYLESDDHGEFAQDVENDYQQEQESYHQHEDFDPRDNEEDLESHQIDTAPPASSLNGGVYEEEAKPGGFDSLVDYQLPGQVPETQAVEHYETADSSVDNIGLDLTANESESSVDSQQLQPHEQHSPKDLDLSVGGVYISDVPADKPEEPASSVEETPASGKEEPSPVAPEAAAGVAAAAVGVTVAAAAAAAATTVKATTTTVKKSSAKAGGKTTTTTTTTKVTKETKATNGKAPTPKKPEITATAASKTTPRKAAESRPTSTATSEKKTPAKPTTSPTKQATTAPAATKAPVPSYAQPVAPRKPRETKSATTEEKKKPATTTSTTTSRASTATHRTPRPQSTTATSSSNATTTASSTPTAAAKTTTKTTVTTTTSRTALLSKPKSSPTKLTNGTAAAPTDTKSTPKKYGIDSKNEGYKPTGGSAKATGEKKEVRTTTKVETATKSSTLGATPSKSPTKTTTPRLPTTPKSAEVKSKIGSMDNATHTPGGGNVKIASKKPDFTNVTSKIGSKDKIDHKPGGGNVKIESKKVKVEAKSKIGSLNNATHKPGGGDKKIETKQLDWKVQSKIGSLDNAEHVAGGGDKKIETKKLEWKANSKIGSLDNAQHVPEGGDKKIETKKLDWKVDSKIGSLDNAQHKAGGGDKKIETKKLDWKVDSKIGSLDNAQHKAGGGDKKIETKKLDWKVDSKVGSLDNAQHKAGGGSKKIEVQKTEWKAQSKIGSLDNVKHKPGGGDDKQSESQKASKIEGPGSGSEHGATEVHNGAASEN